MPHRRIQQVLRNQHLLHLAPTVTVREAARQMSERHVAAVQVALQALERANLAEQQGFPLELLAADWRDAALALDELTGTIVPDDVLDEVFSQFCIGK